MKNGVGALSWMWLLARGAAGTWTHNLYLSSFVKSLAYVLRNLHFCAVKRESGVLHMIGAEHKRAQFVGKVQCV